MAYVTDTHPLVWWLLEPTRLSSRVLDIYEGPTRIHVPSMVLLEIQYLNEIGRIELEVNAVLAFISERADLILTSFDGGVLTKSLALAETRDPFDRIIAATALYYNSVLITKDRWMKNRLPKTVW